MSSLRAVGVAIADLPRERPAPALLESTVQLVRDVIAAGVHERSAALQDEAHPVAKGWPRFLICMLLRPAWACPEAPSLDTAPEWLREAYAEWLFAVPASFAELGEADKYAAFAERQLAELVRWVEANPGAAVVQVALRYYQQRSNFPCLRLSTSTLRPHAELHGRLLQRLAHRKTKVQSPRAIARDGRRLRLGFVVAAFDDSVETRATLPLFSHLDPDRFGTEIFVHQFLETPWEAHARQSALQVQQLPPALEEQVEMISQSNFDVVIFAGEIAGENSALARLATHRMAPLQIAFGAHQFGTTGLSTIDLLIVGDLSHGETAAHQLCERLALIPGPARTFDHAIAPHTPASSWSRTDLNLPPEGTVFVTTANWAQIAPETRNEWARLLAQVPGSTLIVQRIGKDEADAEMVARFCALIDRTLEAHNVADNRLVVMPTLLSSHAELEGLIGLADVFLDLYPSSNDAEALAALKAGVPVVTRAGEPLRTRYVAALLRSLSLNELVADNSENFESIAARLATDSVRRAALAERIKNSMGSVPEVLDTLATGDALGDILETAYDELLAVGSAAFRSERTPVRVQPDSLSTTEHVQSGADALAQGDQFLAAAEARLALRAQPNLASARALLGRSLLALEQPARAVEYLLPAVEAPDADAARWRDLARALNKNGQGGEAVQALQASLQLDPKSPESWLLLIDFAEAAGATDLVRDAFDQLRNCAPDHPRINSLSVRIAS